MTTPKQAILCTIIVTLVYSLQFTPASSYSFPGFSWGWGSENYTRVVTSPEVLRRYPLSYPFKQCSADMEGVMTKISLYPLHLDDGRCVLTRGENVTLEVEFASNFAAESLNGSLLAVFKWYSRRHLGEPQDLCKSEHIECPIKPFLIYRYRTTIFVLPSLPEISPDIKVVIEGPNERKIACGIVPIAVLSNENGKDGLPPSPRETSFVI